jgi:hypothetical protein
MDGETLERRHSTDGRGGAPNRDVVLALARALRELGRGGQSVYEVDVIIRCHPLPPWQIHRAFWWCVSHGWLEPAPREPDAFVVARLG